MQANNVNNEEDVIDLVELFGQLLRHWVLICVSAILVGAISFLISKYLITPQYESTSELYVLSKSTSVTSLADIQLGSNLANDYMVVVGSRPVLDQVIVNLGLDETYKTLHDRVTITNPSNTRILKIAVRDSDPAAAKRIADEIADISAAFISQKMDQAPPSILQYGYSDEPKVSPGVTKNTIIGAFAGALFVMIIIVIAYLVNDAIIDPEDVEKKLGLNLLGTLPLDKKQYNEETRKRHFHKSKR